MGDQYRQSNVGCSYIQKPKMENDFSPKKTMIILVIVVGCFAVLWPKIFYPMLVNSADKHLQPSAIDKTTGCCYVLSETDVDTIKIMSELCGNIIKEQMGDIPLTGKQVINICQDQVFKTCGIDISAVLQEQVRLGQTTKQILDQIRSLNGSLCLKYSFGVQPWRLGVPHIVTLRNVTYNIRQERPTHVKVEMVHPAFREKGRAIPQTPPQPRSPKRIMDGSPGPIPGMRPAMGGAGHIVSPSKQGTGSMGVIMPIYTVGIVIFFTYTLMKIIFKKHPDTDIIYSTIEQDRFRREILGENVSRGSRDSGSCQLVVNAMSALLEEVDQEIEARRRSSEIANQDVHGTNSSLSNGGIKEKPSVKVMSMDTTESCEGGRKWQSANSSVLPTTPSMAVAEDVSPQEIYLDKVLPPQSQILVSDSAVETEENSGDDPAVILAGKMTLSVISLENENLEIDQTSSTTMKELSNDDSLGNLEPAVEKVINDIIDEAIENLENRSDNIDSLLEHVLSNSVNMAELDSCEIPSSNLLNLQATSSEESVDTILSAINQKSSTNEIIDNETKDDKVDDVFEEEESDMEYEESEEEIEVSEDEEIVMHDNVQGTPQQEVSGRVNSNGNAILINGSSPHNDTPQEASDDEEYSEEEEEIEPEDILHNLLYLASNGDREE